MIKYFMSRLGAPPKKGGGGGLNEVLNGEAPPRGPALTLLFTIFDRKDPPFVYLLLTNGIPFTYLV